MTTEESIVHMPKGSCKYRFPGENIREARLFGNWHPEHLSHSDPVDSEFVSPSQEIQQKISLLQCLEHRIKSVDILKQLDPMEIAEMLLDFASVCLNNSDTLTPRRNDDILDPPWLKVERYSGVVNLIHRKNPSVFSRVNEIVGNALSQLAADVMSVARKEIEVADLAVYADRLQDIEDDKASMTETSLRARVGELRKKNSQLDRENLYLKKKNKHLSKKIERFYVDQTTPSQGCNIVLCDQKMKTLDHKSKYYDHSSDSDDLLFLHFGDENEKQ